MGRTGDGAKHSDFREKNNTLRVLIPKLHSNALFLLLMTQQQLKLYEEIKGLLIYKMYLLLYEWQFNILSNGVLIEVAATKLVPDATACREGF